MARWVLPALVIACLAEVASASADEPCRGPGGGPAPPVAYLVSMVGDVRVNGRPPVGALPNGVICAGDGLSVGAGSRAAVYLIGADTPLRLDENTVSRFEPPPEPGGGLVDLVMGGLYFLSEVRRTLTVRTPYVNAGVEGTEVYLRVADARTEMLVLEGRVAATPGTSGGVPFAPSTVTTGQQLTVAQGAVPALSDLPDDGAVFGALRRVTVGALSWTLFYPEVLVGDETDAEPRIAEAARLLVAGQRDQAEALLAQVPDVGSRGRARRCLAHLDRRGPSRPLHGRCTGCARDRARPRGRGAASGAVLRPPAGARPRRCGRRGRPRRLRLAPTEALPQARLAELYLMQGEIRALAPGGGRGGAASAQRR